MKLLQLYIFTLIFISCQTITEEKSNSIVGKWQLETLGKTKMKEDSYLITYEFEKFKQVEIKSLNNDNHHLELISYRRNDSILFIGTSKFKIKKISSDSLIYIDKHSEKWCFSRIQ